MNSQIEQVDMAAEDNTPQQGNIKQEYNVASSGMNLELTLNQIPKGTLTYALNAALENFDANSINYQNEQGNTHCLDFPEGYQLIGKHGIYEKNKHIFFLANPDTQDSEIGYMDNNDCIYHTLVNAKCLNFNINYPIHKVVHKISNCSTEIYWTDVYNDRRYLDIDNIPYIPASSTNFCDVIDSTVLDCNRINVQPDFAIPQLKIVDVINGGDNQAGVYQFAIQYSDSYGNGYTSYHSITNPTPITNLQFTTSNFDYPVGKSIVINISNLDTTRQWEYFNLAVIKTVNSISSVELVGTYFIDGEEKEITYSGQNKELTRLTTLDIVEKFPYYDVAEDITNVGDILVWKGLTSADRVNYQKIANQIILNWETHRIPEDENYANELNATNLRGYLRDEIYALEIVFLLKNGKQTDGFHIPGRKAVAGDLTLVTTANDDFIGKPTSGNSSPYWKIYNTANVIGNSPGYSVAKTYKGPYQYGEFSYWQSKELYPCNTDVWGDLANTPIKHHKFPDVAVSPIFESSIFSSPGAMTMNKNAVFPIGVRIPVSDIYALIQASTLTAKQKAEIVGFKIIRGNRDVNRSIIAKGILRNVGKYNREGTEYFFPNYPYNSIKEDPFLLTTNNAFDTKCYTYKITTTTSGVLSYVDCDTGQTVSVPATAGITYEQCAASFPKYTSGAGTVFAANYFIYELCVSGKITTASFTYTPPTTGIETTITFNNAENLGGGEKCNIVSSIKLPTGRLLSGKRFSIIKKTEVKGNIICGVSEDSLSAFGEDSKSRFVFNSPETSFGQPFLGNVLKLENVMFGAGRGHFVPVKKHATYKLLSKEAQGDALKSASDIATLSSPFNYVALFSAYQTYLTIYINGITRRNYAYSFNSIASYDYNRPINNGLGIKQRELDIAQYLIPGVQNVNDVININNYDRESSVFLKTKGTPLPFSEQTPLIAGAITDTSRFTISSHPDGDCNRPEKELAFNVIAYYASLKNTFDGQWGQIYSYTSVDTGYQRNIKVAPAANTYETVFGGDTFINKFAFKTKLPFFIDNRVNAVPDSDVYYDEIGNIAYPRYWFSSRSELSNGLYEGGVLTNFISYKAHNFDCANDQGDPTDTRAPGRTFYDGKMYLFAYGVPYFYCESGYNVDLRQSFNNKEGDFWPHVNINIPDEWFQENNVTIKQDNTYYYNKTFSKQNSKSNFFSHLPVDWTPDQCYTYFPFRAIYSDVQPKEAVERINNWLIYRPVSYFDFPQTHGKLTAVDGIQNRAILARFENKSLMYNALLTINTSNPQAAYIGNNSVFSSAPPIDFAETDLGYVGSQHKMLLKIPQGQITIDAKRGQVFLITGTQARDLSQVGSGMKRFFTLHLPFEITKAFPDVNVDNHFNEIGLHGVYDSNYNRVIITKLDYSPKFDNISFNKEQQKFYQTISGVQTEVFPVDPDFFCNKSWTLSYNLVSNSWISFHSYLPNWYIGENNFFYSGLNDCCSNIEAIVVESGGIPDTTTSTTTQSSCGFDGYIKNVKCGLLGIATAAEVCGFDGYVLNVGLSCNLAGIAISTITTTSTTTGATLSCNLLGVAQDVIVPTTTTTTIFLPECDLDGLADEI